MTTQAGRNCKIEVALTYDTPLAFTACTKAFPGVATLTAHGLTDGEVGYWTVTAGMVELDSQPVVVDNSTANTIEMAGLDTSNYSTYTAGTLTPVQTWGLVDESGGYRVGGGAADQLQDDRLHLGKHRNVAGLNGAEDITINLKTPEIEGAALAFITRAARKGDNVLLRISKNGVVWRLAYGVPSVYDESVDAGGLGAGSFNVICPAYVLKPNV